MSHKYMRGSIKSSEGSSNGRNSRSSAGHISADGSDSKYVLPTTYGGLGSRFFEQLSFETDKILQVDTINNITETRGSVKARGIQLAIEMQARGIGKNDIILISSKTHAHQTIVLLATLFLGAVVCPISPESPFKECLELVRKLKPKMCFCDSRTVSQIYRILDNLSMTCEIVSFGTELTGTTQFCKLFPYKENLTFKPFFVENPHKEVAFVLPTQGTCGDPKLVCLSHHNLYLQCLLFMELFDNPSKVISFFPLSWETQTILACSSLEFGVTRIMASAFNERNACKMIHDFVIDVAVLGTGLALKMITNVAIKDYNLNCLKCVLVGVVNTSRDDLILMRKALPTVKFLQVYAMTETGFIAAVSALNYGEALLKPTSVGKLLRNCKVKIVDPETKELVAPGQIGELYFYGDGLMLGYFKDSAGTKSAIERGYFKTRDLAKYDEQKWIYLQGRIEDMILFDDEEEPFFPSVLEEVVNAHPCIQDAAVIGNRNELVIVIEKVHDKKLDVENVLMYISKRMPDFDKTINRIIFLDAMPRTSAGTIKRRLLRNEFLRIKIEYTHSLASISPSTLEEIMSETHIISKS